MSKKIRSRSERNFRGPALCQGLEHAMEDRSRKYVQCKPRAEKCSLRNLVQNESVRSNQNDNQKGCRSDILLAFIGILLLRRRRASHIPQSALVSGEGGVVPHVEEDAMGKTSSQSALTTKGGKKKTHLWVWSL